MRGGTPRSPSAGLAHHTTVSPSPCTSIPRRGTIYEKITLVISRLISKGMTDIEMRDVQIRPVHGAAAISVGLAHFAAPQVFEPFNRLGFPQHARTFTYINGGIETTLGILTAVPRTRRHAQALGLCYVGYLATCIAATQVRLRRGLSRDTRPIE